MADGREERKIEQLSESSESTTPHFFGTSRQIVERYCHCQVCGANLHFVHLTDFGRNLTHEHAKCFECGLKTPQYTHRLH